MRHALIEDEKVVNIIEIDPRNASDFQNAVTIPENVGAGIGDTYRDGRFYHFDEETQQEEEILPFDPMAVYTQQLAAYEQRISAQKLALDELTVDTDYRLLMLEFNSIK